MISAQEKHLGEIQVDFYSLSFFNEWQLNFAKSFFSIEWYDHLVFSLLI